MGTLLLSITPITHPSLGHGAGNIQNDTAALEVMSRVHELQKTSNLKYIPYIQIYMRC